MELVNEAIIWLKENYMFLLLLGLGLWYGKLAWKVLIFEPLAGGNGHVQMDELAKGIVLTILILATYQDGHRTHEWTYFSDSFYAILLAAVCGIASIKPVSGILTSYFRKETNGNTSQQSSSSGTIPGGSGSTGTSNRKTDSSIPGEP